MKVYKLPTRSKYVLASNLKIKTGVTLEKPILYKLFNIELSMGGVLTLGAGFHYDCASGPAPDHKGFFRASAIHDAFYILMRDGLLDTKWKGYADDLMRDIMIEDGMPRWYADIAYKAVNKFGNGALRKGLEVVYEHTRKDNI